MASRRQERVAEMLREELSILVSTDLLDPRLEDAMITVTDVKISSDLRCARVYVEHALPQEASHRVIAALAHSEGYLRQSLTENLNLRVIPELLFEIDTTDQHARQIDDILASIARQDGDDSRQEKDADPHDRRGSQEAHASE